MCVGVGVGVDGWSVGGSEVISRRPWEDGWSASSIARIPDPALFPEGHRAVGVPRVRYARIRVRERSPLLRLLQQTERRASTCGERNCNSVASSDVCQLFQVLLANTLVAARLALAAAVGARAAS